MDYKDITLRQYDLIHEVMTDASTSDQQKDVKLLSVLYGKTVKEINAMPSDKVSDMLQEIAFLTEPPKPQPEATKVKYNGVTYSIPKPITYGQLVDIENANDNVSVLNILLIPEGKMYGDDYTNDFADLPYLTAKALLETFLNGLVDSTRRSLKCTRLRLLLTPWRSSPQVRDLMRSMVHTLSLMKCRV